jgi:hypothetical protein
MSYCPPLENKMRRLELIPSGHTWELQIRGRCQGKGYYCKSLDLSVPGCSIWAVELIRREIVALQPDASVNAILIDFFLYDLAKSKEAAGQEAIPHHRTRSIWY